MKASKRIVGLRGGCSILSLGYQNLFVTLSLSLSLSLLKAHQIHCFQRMKVMIPEWGKFLIP